MRVNGLLTERAFHIIEESRKVARLSFNIEDMKAVFHTINTINGLPYGKTVVGEYLIGDYEIPELFSDFIVPEAIRFSADVVSVDYKSPVYREDDGLGVSVLSPLDFMLKWQAILGSIKADSSFKKVTEFRAAKSLSDTGISERLIADTNGLCRDKGIYLPLMTTQNFYLPQVYVIDVVEMFEKWFFNKVINPKVQSK